MKITALLMASTAIGYMSDACEVVLAKVKGSSNPVRVNKHDFDADQEKDAGERQYSKYTGSDEPEQSQPDAGMVPFDSLENVRTQAAPSAPDFSGGKSVSPLPIDEEKNAAAPVAPSTNARLVMKEGSKYFIVDGMGVKLTAETAGGDIDESGYKSEKAAKDAIAALPR